MNNNPLKTPRSREPLFIVTVNPQSFLPSLSAADGTYRQVSDISSRALLDTAPEKCTKSMPRNVTEISNQIHKPKEPPHDMLMDRRIQLEVQGTIAFGTDCCQVSCASDNKHVFNRLDPYGLKGTRLRHRKDQGPDPAVVNFFFLP